MATAKVIKCVTAQSQISTHVQYIQTDTNRQNTLTNRTIGKLITIFKVALSIGAIGTNRFQWKSC